MPSSVTIRALLFDMDGVLVDVSNSYRRAISETVYHFTGREVTDTQIQRYKDEGGYNDDWKLTHAILLEAGVEISFGRVVDEFQRRYRGDNWNGLISREKALCLGDTLRTLAITGRVMGIVTGRPEAEAKWAMERFGWRRFFPLLIPMEKQERRGKPDPFPLQRALATLAAAGMTVQPHEAAYVGDTGDDMIAARRAGMWAIGHVPPYLPRTSHEALLMERGAHCVIGSMDELPAVLGRLHEFQKEEAVAA